MSEFKIEKGVPLSAKGFEGDGYIDALRAMEVGDSFELPEGKALATKRATSYNIGIKLGRKFSWRNRRIWRVA